jgi:hypothetical protein
LRSREVEPGQPLDKRQIAIAKGVEPSLAAVPINVLLCPRRRDLPLFEIDALEHARGVHGSVSGDGWRDRDVISQNIAKEHISMGREFLGERAPIVQKMIGTGQQEIAIRVESM